MTRRYPRDVRKAPRRRIVFIATGLIVLTVAAFGWRLARAPAVVDALAELTWETPTIPSAGMQPQVVRALERQRAVVARDTRSARAWGELGRLFDAHDLVPEAEHCYRRAHALDPRNAQWLYLFAVARDVAFADADEVITRLEGVLALTPYPPAAFRLGDALVRRDRIAEACTAFRRAIAYDPNFVIAHRSLGQALLVQGDLAGAREHLERAARLAPGDGNTQASLAMLYKRIGEPVLATEAARRARSLPQLNGVPDPVRFELQALAVGSRSLGERAGRLMAEGNHAVALEQLALLREARPNDPSVLQRTGECLERLGRRAEAIEAYREAAQIDPSHAAAARLDELLRAGG